jgi:xanthine/uracil/vitamin C permease (AzgA family)
MSDEQKVDTARAARLFDVRRVIGGLFTVYGVIVTILGIFDSQAEIDKAAGVRINLWIGLGMLALGLLFLLWQWLRPAEARPADPE